VERCEAGSPKRLAGSVGCSGESCNVRLLTHPVVGLDNDAGGVGVAVHTGRHQDLIEITHW